MSLSLFLSLCLPSTDTTAQQKKQSSPPRRSATKRTSRTAASAAASAEAASALWLTHDYTSGLDSAFSMLQPPPPPPHDHPDPSHSLSEEEESLIESFPSPASGPRTTMYQGGRHSVVTRSTPSLASSPSRSPASSSSVSPLQIRPPSPALSSGYSPITRPASPGGLSSRIRLPSPAMSPGHSSTSPAARPPRIRPKSPAVKALQSWNHHWHVSDDAMPVSLTLSPHPRAEPAAEPVVQN